MARRYVPAGSATDGADALALTPADAGWTYCGLRVATLAPGEERTFDTGDSELFVLPLSATGLTVTVGADTFEVAGPAPRISIATSSAAPYRAGSAVSQRADGSATSPPDSLTTVNAESRPT